MDDIDNCELKIVYPCLEGLLKVMGFRKKAILFLF